MSHETLERPDSGADNPSSMHVAGSDGDSSEVGGSSSNGGTSAGSDEQVQKLTQECTELKDKLLRMAAESENLRKRMERERSELAKFATEGLLKDMIPVLDSFEQAAGGMGDETGKAGASSSGESASFREGFQMVRKQLLTVLKKHGLEVVESIGQPFDPNLHQAIQRIEDKDTKSDTVHQEFAKGFTLNGRLLRAAMVAVRVPSSGQ